MPLAEIGAERARQTARWGTTQDDAWTPAEWCGLVAHYATRSAVGDLGSVDLARLRDNMLKTAALAVACIESIDRRSAK